MVVNRVDRKRNSTVKNTGKDNSRSTEQVGKCFSEQTVKNCCGTINPDSQKISLSDSSSSASIKFDDSNIGLFGFLGTWSVRWGIGRMNYEISPGLYAVNNPNSDSPVLVTANYKLSYDMLRFHLNNRPAWILVLDTNGINVWCAAAKGSFGTTELIKLIHETGLSNVVSHKTIILPQLGAPGICAYKVLELSGFRAVYGPVRSEDINKYIDEGMKATPEMRQVRFKFYDRVVLVPIEFLSSLKYILGISILFLVISGVNINGYSMDRIFIQGINAVFLLILAGVNGTVIVPIFLPWLPGRPFSIKGIWGGFAIALLNFYFSHGHEYNLLSLISWFFILPSLSSFLSMNFTGATTFTSFSGVKKELKYALPTQTIIFSIGIMLWVIARFI